MHKIIKNDHIRQLRRFFYPDTCAVCRRLTGTGYICDECKEMLDKEATFPTLNVDGSFGIGIFDAESVTARRLVARAKHGKSRAISELFAHYLMSAISKIPDGEDYFITYVPRSTKGKRLYGADQCEMILKTEPVRERSGGSGTLLRRVKFFESLISGEQKHLSRRHRFKNAASAFVYAKEGRAPEKVIVLDDIITSGASSSACRDVLLKCGCEKVIFAFLQAQSGVYEKPKDKRKHSR